MHTFIVLTLMVLISGCTKPVVVAPAQNLAVRGFVAHAERDWPGTPQQQTLTVDTLDWLATAIQSLATAKQLTVPNFAGRMQEFRAELKKFASGKPEQPGQATMLRQLFLSGAALVDDVANSAGVEDADDQLTAVRRAAESFAEQQLPQKQPDVIERYFQAASQALQRVDRGA
jgi:hypothetical protein